MTERSDFRVSLACLSNVQIMWETLFIKNYSGVE